MKQVISIGVNPNDGGGDTINLGGDKINQNFDQLFDSGALVTTAKFDQPHHFVNSPGTPATAIALDKTNATNGGSSAVYYKGAVLSKNSFSPETVVFFTGVNVLSELCLVWLLYDKTNDSLIINIQTGATGDLPTGETAPILTITDSGEVAPVLTIT